MSLSDRWNGFWFNYVHGHNLVYNTCWEDPRIDRVALELGSDDNVMVITSAGCNVLDYALQGPNRVFAVDMNPRQNALLELKLAGIRNLDFETFFQIFGRGRLSDMDRVYRRELRPMLSPWSQTYWDDHLHFFSAGRRNSFYYHGTSGVVAWALNNYLDRTKGLRAAIDALLNAQSLEEQRDIYYGELQSAFWNRFIRWVCGRDMALSLVGVPQAQRRQVERHYTGGIAQFIEECIEAVFAWLPLGDNYFWRVYLTGEYTRDCCPEYLRQENFEHLQGGLVDCVQVDTDTVEGFLRKTDVPISRFVLLDHMDWLSTQRRPLLQAEWQAIVDRAAPDARILWRSGGLKVDFVDPLMVSLRGQQQRVGELLSYHDELAQELHQKDRVHTYGSFYIADLATG